VFQHLATGVLKHVVSLRERSGCLSGATATATAATAAAATAATVASATATAAAATAATATASTAAAGHGHGHGGHGHDSPGVCISQILAFALAVFFCFKANKKEKPIRYLLCIFVKSRIPIANDVHHILCFR
jgi:hypothetical protein